MCGKQLWTDVHEIVIARFLNMRSHPKSPSFFGPFFGQENGEICHQIE